MAVADVRAAAAWYTQVLGMVEHVQIGEGHRAQLGLDGERAELIVRERKDTDAAPGTALQIMFRVDDVDRVLAVARQCGAVTDETSHDWEYGERQAGFIDPFGCSWTLTQTLRDVNPRDWGGKAVHDRR